MYILGCRPGDKSGSSRLHTDAILSMMRAGRGALSGFPAATTLYVYRDYCYRDACCIPSQAFQGCIMMQG